MSQSFGKAPPPTNLPSFGGARIDPNEYATPQQRSSGGSGGGGAFPHREYVDTWRWKAGMSAAIILVPGSYNNSVVVNDGTDERPSFREIPQQGVVKKTVEHYTEFPAQPGRRSFFCSANPYHRERSVNGALCGGCAAWSEGWEWDEAKKKNTYKGSLSKQEKKAITLVHAHPYYQVPSSKIGRNGKPFIDYLPGKGRGCPLAAQNYPRSEGRKFVWDITGAHWVLLVGSATSPPGSSIQDRVGCYCASCGRDGIETVAWACKQCQAPLIDMSTTQMSDADIAARARSVQGCPVCQYAGRLEEVVACKQCKTPRRATLFDGIMHITAVAAMPTEKATEKAFGGTSIQLTRWELIPEDSPYRALLTPLDLDVIRAPGGPDLQLQVCGYEPTKGAYSRAALAAKAQPAAAPAAPQRGKAPAGASLQEGSEPYDEKDDIPFLEAHLAWLDPEGPSPHARGGAFSLPTSSKRRPSWPTGT